MKSLVSSIKKSDVLLDPFPHVVITDPIEAELCSKLISEFPPLKTVTQGKPVDSNQQYLYSANKSLDDTSISPTWREFVKVHTSQAFLREVMFLFKEPILENYPFLEKKIRKIEELKSGIRKLDDFSSADVLLEAQIGINSPVTDSPSSVKRGHVDLPNKLFAGLYYLRDPQDTSTGGEFEIYRLKDKAHRFKGQFIDDKYIELVKTVKYERNVLVLFVNSVKSVHAVSVRSKTDSLRQYLNLVGEVSFPLFELECQERESLSDKLISNSKGALRNIKKVIPFVTR